MADNSKRSIYITERDMERLQGLLNFARPSNKHDLKYFERLEEEVYRATIVKPENIPSNFVTINSKVQLREINSDIEIIFTLVFPSEADLPEHKISILAPIGSAVIGWQAGNIIEWEAPGGMKRVKIAKVVNQPEAV